LIITSLLAVDDALTEAARGRQTALR